MCLVARSAVIAEMLGFGTSVGLGTLINICSARMNPVAVFAGLVALFLLGLVLHGPVPAASRTAYQGGGARTGYSAICMVAGRQGPGGGRSLWRGEGPETWYRCCVVQRDGRLTAEKAGRNGMCTGAYILFWGRENFAISHRTLRDNRAFIRALARVKKAAARQKPCRISFFWSIAFHVHKFGAEAVP